MAADVRFSSGGAEIDRSYGLGSTHVRKIANKHSGPFTIVKNSRENSILHSCPTKIGFLAGQAAIYAERHSADILAGVVGFEPTVHGTKNRCLTTWLHPNEGKPHVMNAWNACNSKFDPGFDQVPMV